MLRQAKAELAKHGQVFRNRIKEGLPTAREVASSKMLTIGAPPSVPFRFILRRFHSLVLLPILRSTSPIPLFSPAHRLSAPARRATPKCGPSAAPPWLAPVRPASLRLPHNPYA